PIDSRRGLVVEQVETEAQILERSLAQVRFVLGARRLRSIGDGHGCVVEQHAGLERSPTAKADLLGLASQDRCMSSRLDECASLLTEADERLERIGIAGIELGALAKPSQRFLGLLELELRARSHDEDVAGDAVLLG